MLDLSIIITTRNRYNMLLNCLDSIDKLDLFNITCELIIVDDASDDETKNLSLKRFKNNKFTDIQIIHTESRIMMTGARNAGIESAKGKYLLFVDDDNQLEKSMVKKLINFAKTNANYGILGPTIYLLHNKKRYFIGQKINLYTSKTTHVDFDYSGEVYDSDGIPNLFMVKKEVFDSCGGFNEEFLQTYSEPELYYRAKKKGYSCGVVLDAITYHDVVLEKQFTPRNLGGMFRQKAYCLMRNRSLIVFMYGHVFHKIVYLFGFSWIWPLVYSLLVLRARRFDLIRLYWLGYIDGLMYLFKKRIICSFVLD